MNYQTTYIKYFKKNIYPGIGHNKSSLKKELYKYFIIIPIYNEYDYILKTLNSLNDQESTYLLNTLVVLIINNSTQCTKNIIQNNDKTKKLILSKNFNFELTILDYYSKKNALPIEEFKIGTIRKIGMDFTLQLSNAQSLLFCLDADCVVSKDYLKHIIKCYKKYKFEAATVNFKHQKSNNPTIEKAIRIYEKQLYYIAKKIKQCKSPYGHVSMGSTIICTSKAYVAISGMPQRKAAEDFYFLQSLAKFTTIYNITDILVYPSSREEERIYLGTGHRMREYRKHGRFKNLFFSHQAYDALKKIIWIANNNYNNSYKKFNKELNKTFNDKICNFLNNHNIKNIWERINAQAKSEEQFMLFFHQWFDALKIIQLFKYLN